MKFSTDIRKEQIKVAVLDIVHTEGLKKMTTKRLAEKVGMSEAAIFKHYSSKHAILLDILDDVQQQLISPLREIAFQSASAQDRLTRAVCHTITFLVENKGINLLMLSEAAVNNDDELKGKLYDIFNSQRQIIEKILLDGINAGEFKPTTDYNTFSMLYMGIPVAVNVEMMLNIPGFNMNGLCDKMTNMLLKIII